MMIHRSIARYAVALAGAGALAFVGLSGLASAATIPVSVKVEQPVPSLTESTVFGSASSEWNQSSSAAPTAGTQTSLAFPTASITSSSGATVAASDWVGLSVSVANATSSTNWEVYGSSTALTNSSDSSDTIPASDVLIPSPDYGSGGGSFLVGGSGSYTDSVPGTAPSGGTLSATATVEYNGFAASGTDLLAIQPAITIPAGQAVGTYTGTITLSAALQ